MGLNNTISHRQVDPNIFRVAMILSFMVLLRPAYAADDLLTKAVRCSDFDSCLDVMLYAAHPRQPEAISVAATRIGELGRPPRGNRKAARDLNTKGLNEFKLGHFPEAAALLERAAREDASDVEIQANFGFALLRSGRLPAAQVALKAALTINPRRTATWVPMAEYFLAAGESAKAVAALLLAYEFSENRETTHAYFAGKAAAAEQGSTIYMRALQKLDETPRSIVQGWNEKSSKAMQGASITKNEAKLLIAGMVNSDADLAGNPVKKAGVLCLMDAALDEAFRGVATLDETALESRLRAAADRITAGVDKNTNSESAVRIRDCVASAVVEQANQGKSAQAKQSPAARTLPPAPPMDLDDLRLDIASLNGRFVKVSAVGYYMMDMFMLKKSATDMSPIVVDVSRVPREDRRQMIQKCADLMSGCRVTVHGTVGKVSFQNGLLAERLEW